MMRPRVRGDSASSTACTGAGRRRDARKAGSPDRAIGSSRPLVDATGATARATSAADSHRSPLLAPAPRSWSSRAAAANFCCRSSSLGSSSGASRSSRSSASSSSTSTDWLRRESWARSPLRRAAPWALLLLLHGPGPLSSRALAPCRCATALRPLCGPTPAQWPIALIARGSSSSGWHLPHPKTAPLGRAGALLLPNSPDGGAQEWRKCGWRGPEATFAGAAEQQRSGDPVARWRPHPCKWPFIRLLPRFSTFLSTRQKTLTV